MRKILAALGAAVLVLSLGACASSEGDEAKTETDTGYGNIETYTVPLPDGGTAVCVVWEGYKAGGIACDWEGASNGL